MSSEIHLTSDDYLCATVFLIVEKGKAREAQTLSFKDIIAVWTWDEWERGGKKEAVLQYTPNDVFEASLDIKGCHVLNSLLWGKDVHSNISYCLERKIK